MTGRKERQTRMAPGYGRASFMSWATVPQREAHWERRYFIGSGRTYLSPRHGMKRGKLEARVLGLHTPEPVKNRRSQYRLPCRSKFQPPTINILNHVHHSSPCQ
jgi:hypothetical protein